MPDFHRVSAADGVDPVQALLLAIYQTARESPHAQFHDAALRLLKTVIPFDFAKWGSSHVSAEGVIFHEAHLHAEPPEIVDAYRHVCHQDTVALFIAANIGLTGNFHNPIAFSGPHHRAIRDYTVRYRHSNSLITARRDSISGLMNSLSLYRADPGKFYSERERRLCQFLVPHLMEARLINRLLEIERVRAPDSRGAVAMAIADPFGTIHFAEEGFDSLLRAEWSAHQGNELPKALQQALLQAGEPQFLGHAILLKWAICKNLYFVRGRKRLPVDGLTPRELAIAREISQGFTHKEVARKLGIAPSTVRNHPSIIHERAQARNNAELAAQLRVAGL